jgi:hypothetical protein
VSQVQQQIQRQVQQAINEMVEMVESGAERGIQVAVYRRGELVVDTVAGTRTLRPARWSPTL